MYEVGQLINIGYWAGFHHQTLIKAQAEITEVYENFIYIRIPLPHGGYRKMFGYANELRELENNYND